MEEAAMRFARTPLVGWAASFALASLLLTVLPGASATGAAFGTAPSCIAPPAGLVGWWPGDGDANDRAGTSNGILRNGTGFAGGEVSQSFALNGSGNVEVPNAPALNPINQLTIEAWIYPTVDKIDADLISKDGELSSRQYFLQLDANPNYHPFPRIVTLIGGAILIG